MFNFHNMHWLMYDVPKRQDCSHYALALYMELIKFFFFSIFQLI